jgi:hypothetical protein
MDFHHGAALLAVYVKHAEAHPDADIPDLKEKVGHIRLSLLRFGQTDAEHIAVDHACAVVVDFLIHRDEDWRLQDVMLALDRLKTAADHEPPKAEPPQAN